MYRKMSATSCVASSSVSSSRLECRSASSSATVTGLNQHHKHCHHHHRDIANDGIINISSHPKPRKATAARTPDAAITATTSMAWQDPR